MGGYGTLGMLTPSRLTPPRSSSRLWPRLTYRPTSGGDPHASAGQGGVAAAGRDGPGAGQGGVAVKAPLPPAAAAGAAGAACAGRRNPKP